MNDFLIYKYIAHRGFYNENNPENSLAAFEEAIKHNYAIELDVRITKDDVPIVFHDHDLKRMAGTGGYIENINYEKIKTFTLLNSEEKIPSLKEALEFIKGRVPILVHIKNDAKTGIFEKNIYKALKDYPYEYAVGSYNPHSLEWFKNYAPTVTRCQYADYFKGQDITFAKKGKLKKLKYNKDISDPHYVIYNANHLPNRFVKRCKLPIIAYNVKNQTQYMQVVKHCDNIIFSGFKPVI